LESDIRRKAFPLPIHVLDSGEVWTKIVAALKRDGIELLCPRPTKTAPSGGASCRALSDRRISPGQREADALARHTLLEAGRD
jgi:hypothetical protein